MDILVEKPIENKAQDKLKRKNFAGNLALKLNNYEVINSITIGLMGTWGCGKTSIINMVKEEIDKEKFCIIDFNPWYFSGRKQLLSDFFEVLAHTIGNEKNGKISKIGSYLSLYAKALKPVSLIPQLAPILMPATNGMEAVSSFIKEYLEAQKLNLGDMKKQINEQLKNYDKKVLVIIDEIDRLENDEIKEIFQLVRALGDFDNVIYLLAFDKEKINGVFSSGKEYIDKIINIPLHVPDISFKDINSIFINEIDGIFESKDTNDIQYWNRIFDIVFKNKFYNLRELNKFLNIIRFNVDYVAKNINSIDYMVITFLKLFDEKVFDFIKNKKELFLGNKNKEIKNDITELKLISEREIHLENLFNVLFFDKGHGGKRRIMEKKYFDTYFQYELAENAFSIEQINEFINIKSKEKLVEKLKETKDLLYLFENIDEFYERLDKEQLVMYIEVLISKISMLNKQKANSFVQSEQKKAFATLKSMTGLLEKIDDIEKIIDGINLNEEYELISILDYLLYVINYYKHNKLKENVTNKIEQYIYRIPYSNEVETNFNKLKSIGVNVKKYIEHIASKEEGIIGYLESLVVIVDVGQDYTYDKNGEPDGVETYDTKAIVLENITDYIDYQEVKVKVDNMSQQIKDKNKELIKLFYTAKPYKEVYAYQIQEEEFEKSNY